LDENGIKADCFEKDIKNVITQHDKIHSWIEFMIY
jgi:hypothetical protein